MTWHTAKLDREFKVDTIVLDKAIFEIKPIEHLGPVHKRQLLTYLKFTDLELGLLINFDEALIKNGITRVVYNL